jgi:hypothetical protein
MARLITKSDARHRGILALGRLIASGNVMLCANPSGDLDQIMGFVPDLSIRFGSFEFTADSGGNLLLTRALVLPEDPAISTDLAVEPLLDSFGESHLNTDPASSKDPISFPK